MFLWAQLHSERADPYVRCQKWFGNVYSQDMLAGFPWVLIFLVIVKQGPKFLKLDTGAEKVMNFVIIFLKIEVVD